MLIHYTKTLVRQLKKNKLHSFINIIGMAVALTCSIFLLLIVYFQLSFDNFHKEKARIFEVYSSMLGPQGEELSSSVGYPMAPTLKAEGIGIEKATRIKPGGRGLRYGSKELELQTTLVDPDFFTMFSFPILKGNQQNPLHDEANAVISDRVARQVFNNEDPIGKSISVSIGRQWKTLTISAVIKDFPKNSSIKYDILARVEISPDYAETKNSWYDQTHVAFVMLSPQVKASDVEKRLRYFCRKYTPGDPDFLKSKGYRKDDQGDMTALHLLPLADIHFNPRLGGGDTTPRPLIGILLLVALVILLIACFNFINLSIGLAFTRTREMGVRKCLGALRQQLWLHVWGESLLTEFMALVISVTATVLLIRYLNKTTHLAIDSSLLLKPAMVITLLIVLLFVSFITSAYPSWMMGRLKAVEVLKGKISVKKPGLFRNGLIVMQFVIATVFISSTFVIYRQFQHLRQAPLGYTTSSLISIPIHDQEHPEKIVHRLRQQLASESSIVSVTGSSINLGIGQDHSTTKIGSSFNFQGRSISTQWLTAGIDFLKTLHITPIEGRDFSSAYDNDSSRSVIVTQSMARELATGSVVGRTFSSDSAQPPFRVVGVIPDFHLYSMHEKPEPLTITLNGFGQLAYALIRVSTANATTTMDRIKKVYAGIEPGAEFKGSYVDDNIDAWYQNERQLATFFSVAALVAVIISLMGLFGLVFMVIQQSVKQIGIRKVLGATAGGIAVLVTKQFLRPVILAVLIATPIAWWAMNIWLQTFVYRVQLQWTIFLAVALIAIILAAITVGSQAIKAALANPVKSLHTE